MLNKILLIGNLGRNPEIQVAQDGRKVAKISLATSSKWKNEANEWQEHTDWHRIIVFRETTVNWIKDELKKGDQVFVGGKLTYRLHEGTQGKSCWIPYIVISGQTGWIQIVHRKEQGVEASRSEDNSDIPDSGESSEFQQKIFQQP